MSVRHASTGFAGASLAVLAAALIAPQAVAQTANPAPAVQADAGTTAPADPNATPVSQLPTGTPATAAPEAATDTIVVTGSRIANTGFTAPTPVTVVGEAQIARQGATNIAQILNEIPAFRAQSSPSTSAIFVSNLGASTADLRGLGGNRTLVLIDGRRVVASTVAGGSFTPANTVDLNLVPAILLERAEVVTGGASAAYGSDAVAGVTNLIVNRRLKGLSGRIQFGTTEQGDNHEYSASLAYGTRFADDRGSFVIGAEYVNNKGTGDCYTRDWCAVNYNTVSNPFVAGSTTTRVIPGQPATLILPNARTATGSLGGLVIAGPLRGTEFGPGGAVFQHNYGTYGGAGLFQSGGGDPVLPFYQFYPLSAPSERINTLADVSFDVSDSVRLFGQGSYGHVQGTVLGAARRDISPAGAYQIQRDNAFLPASVVAQMTAAGVTSLPFGRLWNDIGPQVGDVTRETFRGVAGLDWKFGNGLSFNAYYQYGQTNYKQRGYNTTVNSRMGFAIDAVRDASGNIVCRATLPGAAFRAAAAGCVPLNPFGLNSGSPAAFDYVTETAAQDAKIKQHVAAVELKGNIIDLWAGPLAFATGAEYRKDIASSVTDPISAANDFHTSPGGGIVGGSQSLNVKEGFLELSLPIAKDLAFARSAGLNGAVRVTDYSTSGTVTTWKIGADWEPFEFLRLRGTRSRDIRAPNLFELYGAPQSSFQTVDDPANGGARGLYPTLLSGNANLNAEVAKTWTAGAVVTGRFGSAGTLRVSADYYDINLRGAISQLGAQIIVNRCQQGVTALCSFVTRGSSNQIVSIVNANLNLNTLITRGWDFEADYTLRFGNGSSLNLRGLATVVKDLITVDSAGVGIDRAGQNGSGVSQPSGVPDYTINGYITYQTDRFSVQAQVRHISSGRYQVTNIGPDEDGYSPLNPASISDNHVKAMTYVNLNGQFKLIDRGSKSVELFGVVSNLFDKDPPNDIPSSFGPTNNVLYDVLGRSYRVGVRFTY